MNVRKCVQHWVAGLILVCSGLLLTGCKTGSSQQYSDLPGTTAAETTNAAPVPPVVSGTDMFRPGDTMTITFTDTPDTKAPMTQQVREDGTITLLENQTFVVTNKTRGPLEQEIRARYVPKIYLRLTVSITPMSQFFYVGGEVKAPQRQLYTGPITVLKAIQSCGDFTDFANKKQVSLVRNDGRTLTVNCVKAIKNPTLDLPVYPGDKIHVPRSVF
jgi:protein involved in polysaccharide export with SLBB domain